MSALTLSATRATAAQLHDLEAKAVFVYPMPNKIESTCIKLMIVNRAGVRSHLLARYLDYAETYAQQRQKPFVATNSLNDLIASAERLRDEIIAATDKANATP